MREFGISMIISFILVIVARMFNVLISVDKSEEIAMDRVPLTANEIMQEPLLLDAYNEGGPEAVLQRLETSKTPKVKACL